MTLKVDNYFGGCPHCGRTDGCTNVGPSHWYFCKAHKTKWCIGSNLFSSWKEQTEDEQRRAYDAIGMGVFTEVEPLPCTEFVSKANLLPDTGKRYPSDAAPGRMPAHKGGDEAAAIRTATVLRKVEADLHAAFPDVHFKLTPRWFKSGRSFSVGRADLLTRMLERRSRSLSPAAIRARRSRALRRDCVVILRVRAPAGVG